jgi:hypothetical protein
MSQRDPIQWLGFAKEAIVAALAIFSWIVVWHRRRSALHWLVTYGTVELGIDTDTDNKWIADLSYSYSVASEFYSGRIVLCAKNDDDAQEKIRRWKGQALMVRYSPTRPHISVIRPEDQQSWALPILKSLASQSSKSFLGGNLLSLAPRNLFRRPRCEQPNAQASRGGRSGILDLRMLQLREPLTGNSSKVNTPH